MYREVYPYQNRRSRLEVFPGLGFRLALRSGIGDGVVGVVSRRRAPDDHCARAASRSRWPGFALQSKPLCGEAPSRKGCLGLYDPENNEWVFADSEGRQLSRRSADELSPERS